MFYQKIDLEKKENVIIIHIIGPLEDQVKLTRLCEEFDKICDDIFWDENIKVIVLTGIGEKCFSMTLDASGSILRSKEEQRIQLFSNVGRIARFDRPVIVAINGDAIGLGLELALACDIRIASEASRFGLPQIQSGMMPWDGGTQRLSRLVGKSKALEMILIGEMMSAQEALRIGLVNRVLPTGELMEAALKMAQEMASKGPIALRYAKEGIYKGMDMTLEQGLRFEADLYLLLNTTKDRVEGIKAFREKRTPKFEGK